MHVLDAWPEFAHSPAQEITPKDIAAIIRRVRESGKERTAGILRNYLTAAYNAARRAPFDSAMSCELIQFDITNNPAEVVPAIPVNRGERTLTAEELRLYMLSLGNNEAGFVLKLALMAGGQRLAQLVRAKVSDYSADTGTLRLWDAKGKRSSAREHLLPLGPKAIGLVQALIERRSEADSRIFGASERTAGNKVAEVSAAIGHEPFDLRDIRRTCETMLAGMGINRDTRAQLLSHGISGVQAAHYDKHSYTNEKRNTLIAWEQRLEEIEAGQQAANVVQIVRKQSA